MSGDEITNRAVKESDEQFISELRERIRNYKHKSYEKNGYTYFRFSGYSLRINNKFFLSIKQKLYE